MVDVSSLQQLTDAESLLRMVEEMVILGETLGTGTRESEFPWRGVNLTLKNAAMQLEQSCSRPLELVDTKSNITIEEQNPISSSIQQPGGKSRKRSSVLDRIQPLPLKNSTADSGF